MSILLLPPDGWTPSRARASRAVMCPGLPPGPAAVRDNGDYASSIDSPALFSHSSLPRARGEKGYRTSQRHRRAGRIERGLHVMTCSRVDRTISTRPLTEVEDPVEFAPPFPSSRTNLPGRLRCTRTTRPDQISPRGQEEPCPLEDKPPSAATMLSALCTRMAFVGVLLNGGPLAIALVKSLLRACRTNSFPRLQLYADPTTLLRELNR